MKLASLGAGCRRMRTRFWTCVDRCSQGHSDDEHGTDFFGTVCSWVHTPTVPLFEHLCCNGVTLPKTLERIRPCQLDMERAQMMTRCKTSLRRKGREGQRQTPNPVRKSHDQNTSFTDINTCKNCGRTGHWAEDCWRPSGRAYDNSTSKHSNTQKGKNHKNGKGRSKHVDVVGTNQPSETASTVLYPSQTPSTIGELSFNSFVDPWIMGVTINSTSTRRQAGGEYLFLDSGAQHHACPIKYPGQKVPLPDPGIHTASGARLKHDGGRLVTYKLQEGRTIRVLFHACAV